MKNKKRQIILVVPLCHLVPILSSDSILILNFRFCVNLLQLIKSLGFLTKKSSFSWLRLTYQGEQVYNFVSLTTQHKSLICSTFLKKMLTIIINWTKLSQSHKFIVKIKLIKINRTRMTEGPNIGTVIFPIRKKRKIIYKSTV